jgi:hypothetical protein
VRRFLLTCLATLVATPTTFAGFNVRFNNAGYGLVGSIAWTSADGNNGSGNFFVGQLSFQHHYVSPGDPGSQFFTYCIDLRGRINTGMIYSVEERNLSSYVPNDQVGRLAFLYDKYGDNDAALPSFVDTASKRDKWFAALQLAIWRLTLVNPSTFTSSLLSDSTTLNYFNGFLTEALSSEYGSNVKWLDRGPNPLTGNAVGQHLLYNPPQTFQPPPDVPAPGGLVLAAAGGAFFSFTSLGRRFRQAAN